MKKIVITGGLGYIGMALQGIFRRKDYEIKVIDTIFSSSRVNQLRNGG